MITHNKGMKLSKSQKIMCFLLAVLMIALLTATSVAAAANIYTTYVYCDNEMIRVISFSTSAEDILHKANVVIEENDLVDMTSYVPGENEGMIYIYRACQVNVVDSGKTYFVNTAGTVENALEQAGISLRQGDSVNYDQDIYVFDDMRIEVTRAFGVTVIADGKSKSYSVSRITVQEVLNQAGVKLGKNDTINCSLMEKVKEGMKIVVHRVSYKKHTQTQALKYTTEKVEDSTMYKDESKVIKEGVNGKKKVTYSDKYIDGELVKSTVIDTEVIKKATPQKVAVGTNSRPVVKVKSTGAISELTPPSSLKLDENGRPVNYKKIITGKATAYYTGTTCSTGLSVLPGRVAVNPRQIPYGTKMYIVSSDGKYVYGYSVAADTGGFATNGSGTVVDLYFHTYGECINFGRRTVEIYILE